MNVHSKSEYVSKIAFFFETSSDVQVTEFALFPSVADLGCCNMQASCRFLRFDSGHHCASGSKSCETPNALSEHASAAAPFLALRDSCSRHWPGRSQRKVLVERLGRRRSGRKSSSEGCSEVNGSNDSSTIRIGGESSEHHLLCFNLDLFTAVGLKETGRTQQSNITRRDMKGGNFDQAKLTPGVEHWPE
jgi:hypothetical protein